MSTPEMMEACVLHAVGDLRHERVSVPRRAHGEVLLKVMACGICGSDVPRVFEKGTYRFPTIPGHEFAGIVAEADDAGLVGMRAAVFPLLPCGVCDACRAERYAQCAHYNYLGSRCDGGFAEYVAVPEWNLVPVPDGLRFEEAAMCEPAAVARHAALIGGIGPGDAVAIFGAGPVGLMLAQWARSFGAVKVILADIDPHKVAFAGAMGFTAVNGREADAVALIQLETGGRGADVCVEGSGSPQAWAQCLGAAAAFGRVVLMGNPADEMALPQQGYAQILRKELTLRGTWNSSFGRVENDWREAVRAMEDGRLNLKSLVSHRFPLSGCAETFGVMRRRAEFFNKVMFTMGEETR